MPSVVGGLCLGMVNVQGDNARVQLHFQGPPISNARLSLGYDRGLWAVCNALGFMH